MSPDKQQHQQQVADIAKRYPGHFATCRVDTGHHWVPVTAAWLQGGKIERVLQCSRCETKRVQILNKDGYITASRYVHPEGYVFVGIGRLNTDDRAVFRRTHILRELD